MPKKKLNQKRLNKETKKMVRTNQTRRSKVMTRRISIMLCITQSIKRRKWINGIIYKLENIFFNAYLMKEYIFKKEKEIDERKAKA